MNDAAPLTHRCVSCHSSFSREVLLCPHCAEPLADGAATGRGAIRTWSSSADRVTGQHVHTAMVELDDGPWIPVLLTHAPTTGQRVRVSVRTTEIGRFAVTTEPEELP